VLFDSSPINRRRNNSSGQRQKKGEGEQHAPCNPYAHHFLSFLSSSWWPSLLSLFPSAPGALVQLLVGWKPGFAALLELDGLSLDLVDGFYF
jgi:hypothetical protein